MTRRLVHKARFGLLVNRGACWVGWHYSPYNKRVCLNLIPCVTVWIIGRGGIRP